MDGSDSGGVWDLATLQPYDDRKIKMLAAPFPLLLAGIALYTVRSDPSFTHNKGVQNYTTGNYGHNIEHWYLLRIAIVAVAQAGDTA